MWDSHCLKGKRGRAAEAAEPAPKQDRDTQVAEANRKMRAEIVEMGNGCELFARCAQTLELCMNHPVQAWDEKLNAVRDRGAITELVKSVAAVGNPTWKAEQFCKLFFKDEMMQLAEMRARCNVGTQLFTKVLGFGCFLRVRTYTPK
jgi:hypothetical protein